MSLWLLILSQYLILSYTQYLGKEGCPEWPRWQDSHLKLNKLTLTYQVVYPYQIWYLYLSWKSPLTQFKHIWCIRPWWPWKLGYITQNPNQLIKDLSPSMHNRLKAYGLVATRGTGTCLIVNCADLPWASVLCYSPMYLQEMLILESCWQAN